MKRTRSLRRRLLLATFVFICSSLFIIALSLYLQRDFYLQYAKQEIIKGARSQGIRLDWHRTTVSASALHLQRVEVLIPRILFGILIDDVRISAQRLLSLSPQIVATGHLYGGDFVAAYTSIANPHLDSLALNDINLAAHQQFAGLGVKNGLLHIKLETKESSTTGSLRISNLSKPGISKLPRNISKLPIELAIPEITSLDALANFSLAPNAIQINSMVIVSSLGRAEGAFRIPRNQRGDYGGSITVELGGEGKKALAPWLPLISRGTLNEGTSRFRVALSGPANTPQTRFEALPFAPVQNKQTKAASS